MKNGFTANHWDDPEGRPGGGCSYGTGFAIAWQNGPLGRGSTRQPPNGAFVEDILAAVVDRLEYYQNGEFACLANEQAIQALQGALAHLESRTREREARQVEGTHQR